MVNKISKSLGIWRKKAKAWIGENKGFSCLLLIMSVYYGWRMFALDPWYDELYTYYSFISRGPVYAAIHWPVPNNHVFYSVLSGFLMIFGNPYIALRGISWLFCVGNLIMLYTFAKRFFSRSLSLSCVAIYSSFYLVNYLSIQGRGYTLSTGLYLLALVMLYEICVDKRAQFRYYAIFSLSLTGGLYAIPSNVYWVLPLCLAGGLYLLFSREIKTLLKLITASMVAAFNTFCLYSLIWLAIGSNLLSKTPDSGYFGIHQIKIILTVPLAALKRGMDYMLASPYVQSIDREKVIRDFFSWTKGLLELFSSTFGGVLLIILIVTVPLCIWGMIRGIKAGERKLLFLSTYLISLLWGLPLILILQAVQPYYRVFTFLGVPLAVLLTVYLSQIKQKGWEMGILTVCLLWAAFWLSSPYYNGAYADRESKIKEIWKEAGISQAESICFMDDYQRYVLKFYWNLQPSEVSLEEAQYILLPKEVISEDYEVNEWPVLYNHEGVNWEYLSACQVIKETGEYILYRKR